MLDKGKLFGVLLADLCEQFECTYHKPLLAKLLDYEFILLIIYENTGFC